LMYTLGSAGTAGKGNEEWVERAFHYVFILQWGWLHRRKSGKLHTARLSETISKVASLQHV
jgi:hypothetical protein